MYTVEKSDIIRNAGTLANVEFFISDADGTELTLVTMLLPGHKLSEGDIISHVTDHKSEIIAKSMVTDSRFSRRAYENCGINVAAISYVAIGDPIDVIQIVMSSANYEEN